VAEMASVCPVAGGGSSGTSGGGSSDGGVASSGREAVSFHELLFAQARFRREGDGILESGAVISGFKWPGAIFFSGESHAAGR
jgi:hypothetical protein